MAKVTSKLQVTLPKRLAEQFGIRPGDTITWEAQPDAIRITTAQRGRHPLTAAERLRLFDRASKRDRDRRRRSKPSRPRDRGWTREELYRRGRAR